MDVDSEDPRRADRSSGGECTPEEPFVPGAVGISSALAVISRAASVSGRVDGGPWTEPELDLLEQVRLWAPVQDLRKAQAALLAQKDILVKRYAVFQSVHYHYCVVIDHCRPVSPNCAAG
jgi:hypothetical protein